MTGKLLVKKITAAVIVAVFTLAGSWAIAQQTPGGGDSQTPAAATSDSGFKLVARCKGLDYIAMFMQCRCEFEKFSPAVRYEGIVNKKAIACYDRRTSPLRFAIDSADKKSKSPDVLRIAMADQRDFADAVTVKFSDNSRGSSSYKYYNFNQSDIKLQLYDISGEISVQGEYLDVQNGRYKRLRVDIYSAIEADCTIAGQKYTVALIDGNSNLQHQDKPTNPKRGEMGDFICVFSEGQSGPSLVGWGAIAQPIEIDGKFYKIDVDIAARSVKSEAVELKSTAVNIDAQQWAITLRDSSGEYYIASNRQKNIPKGAYICGGYAVQKDNYMLACELSSPRRLNLNEDATSAEDLDIFPLMPVVSASTRRGAVSFNFAMADAAGKEVDYYSRNGTLPKPKLEVLDKSGEVIYTANFEYG